MWCGGSGSGSGSGGAVAGYLSHTMLHSGGEAATEAHALGPLFVMGGCTLLLARDWIVVSYTPSKRDAKTPLGRYNRGMIDPHRPFSSRVSCPFSSRFVWNQMATGRFGEEVAPATLAYADPTAWSLYPCKSVC
jgi:hypothetical protein